MSRSEPVLSGQAPAEALPPGGAAILAIAIRRPAEEPVDIAAPDVVVATDTPEAEAPAVRLEAPQGGGGPAPPIALGDRDDGPQADRAGRRLSASVIASVVLHVGAVGLFAWLSLIAPSPMTTGEDAVPVELVVAAEAGAASQQETASGQQESRTDTSSEQRQAVEAPQQETPPETQQAEAQPPDPMATAEQVLDTLPPPPMPETPVIEPPPPAPQPEQRVETEASSEVQAVTQPAQVTPPQVTPPPVRQPPVVRRPPPQVTPPQVTPRREPPRPVRQAVTTPRPERPTRPVRQTASQAATPERGQGTGQRNRQAAAGSAAGGAASAGAVASYRARVLAHLARFKVYPDSARERGISGRTAVTFTLSRSGGVTSVGIASSSGAGILDQATLAMVRRAVPFPPMPEGSAGSMSFTAGINYSLR